jgi:hypothetical protein
MDRFALQLAVRQPLIEKPGMPDTFVKFDYTAGKKLQTKISKRGFDPENTSANMFQYGSTPHESSLLSPACRKLNRPARKGDEVAERCKPV